MFKFLFSVFLFSSSSHQYNLTFNDFLLEDDTKLQSYLSNVSALMADLNNNTQEDIYDASSSTELPSLLALTTKAFNQERKKRKKQITLAIQPSECSSFQKLDEDDEKISFHSEIGVSVNISCLSRAPHQWWSTANGFDPEISQKWYESLSEMTHLDLLSDVDYSRFRFRSTLHLTNLTHQDVGLYTCRSLSRSRQREPLEEQVYLFVNDLDHPAAVADNLDVLMEIGSRAVLPCRPSHPDFEVELRRDEVDLSNLFPFSPDEGFIVNPVTVDMTGQYECLFSSLHLFEEARVFQVKAEKPHKKFGTLDGILFDKEGISGESDCGQEIQAQALLVVALGLLYFNMTCI